MSAASSILAFDEAATSVREALHDATLEESMAVLDTCTGVMVAALVAILGELPQEQRLPMIETVEQILAASAGVSHG